MSAKQPSEATGGWLPTVTDPYVIAEEFCGDCGESIGYDLRPLTLRCAKCGPERGLLARGGRERGTSQGTTERPFR